MEQADRLLLADHFEGVDLRVGETLINALEPFSHAYFVTNGLISVIATGGGRQDAEVGVYGFDGMGSIACLLGSDRCAYKHTVQVEGTALRIKCAPLRAAIHRSQSLADLLSKYAHTFIVMTAYTAVANSHYRLDERLARWLLMSHDRAHNSGIALTHEFLAKMLGARRPSVTDAINMLEGLKCVRARRGYIEITDREALKKMAGTTYGVAEAEYRRLIGGPEIFP